jgi:DNA-binding NtrC family response regulator
MLIIADDNEAMRWLVRSTLAEPGMEVAEAHDGRSLFWLLVRCSFTRPARDVTVITDMCMPVYSGLDVIAAFDELGYHPQTFVITAYPSAEVSARIASRGAHLVPKPFATAMLRDMVEHAWRR